MHVKDNRDRDRDRQREGEREEEGGRLKEIDRCESRAVMRLKMLELCMVPKEIVPKRQDTRD